MSAYHYDPDYNVLVGHAPRLFSSPPTTIPKPEENDTCMTVCRWKYQAINDDNHNEKELFFANKWDGERGQEKISEIVPAPNGVHRGALAPKWVFEKMPLSTTDMTNMTTETYQQRFISVLAGRFVCILRPDAHTSESLIGSKGLPQPGARSWWRYWDNEKNVYQVTMDKWRYSLPKSEDDFQFTEAPHHSELYGPPPGHFDTKGQLWMTSVSSRIYRGGEIHNQKVMMFLPKFWEAMWTWNYSGRGAYHSMFPEWDECLKHLAELEVCACFQASRH